MILITAGGVLLSLSHAAAWQLGRKPRAAAAQHADFLSTPTSDSTASPADLVRLGREYEATTREQREQEKLPWRDQVAAARAKLPADANFAALVREGMAAARVNRDYASAQTVAAFGRWLDLAPDAALEFIGNINRGQSTDPFRFEIGRWLGQGNERRFDELVKRFPRAAWPLRQAAQELCAVRGAGFALEMAASLEKPADRLWLLGDCLDAKQWQGHLAGVSALLSDPQAIRQFLSSITRDEDAAVLLNEIRAAGFPPDDVTQAETRMAERAEEASRREFEKEKDRKEREKSASALRRQLGLAGTSHFDRDSPSEEQQLERVAPGFADAYADLRDGRQSMEGVLALVKRSWPPASDSTVEKNLRSMLFDVAFTADALDTVKAARAAGWDCDSEVENGVEWLPPEMVIRLLEVHPDILQDKEGAAFQLYFRLFDHWQEVDPEDCRRFIQAVPDELLRTRWLERFDSNADKMSTIGGGP